MKVISRGYARGGSVAVADALKLWTKCAVGGADYSVLPYNSASKFVRLRAAIAGFEAAVEVLTFHWNSERTPEFQMKWRADARETLTRAAGHLLAACKEIERGNQSDASFEKGEECIRFWWNGTFTEGRWVTSEVVFSDTLLAYLEWDVATGKESTYLHLPSMTDEAVVPEGRREGGWTERSLATD